ncbi:MAG: 2,6-beta-D-fructofuranosidase [Prevotellaceae bacterium]|nr:2,6-beta-D-fructofuranosidase [Prevotellaceae bacterium]
MQKHTLKFIILGVALSLISCGNQATNRATAQKISIEITENHLNLPVSQQAERGKMSFSIGENIDRTFVIRLAETPEYWVAANVSAYKGKTLKIAFEGDAAGLSKIYQSEQPEGAENFYLEENRPQLHFTTKIGWINDPNGLIFYEGEYHLFYQHNPFEREWENMTWGHAVSADLVHWTELGDALFPDKLGAMFSGTAVIDYENTSGFGTKENPPFVVFYTADHPDRETQCLAYSLDKGRTFTKYAGNPVIDSKEKWNSHDTRDPKVFWYAPGKQWVLVVNERDGHSIYNSANLKDWTYQSHVDGFWECPELFELAIDNSPANKLWVMYGASGTYFLGKFDGKTFTPLTGKLQFEFGAVYAAQTFNNIPASDGRRIQIGWDRVEQPGMRFKGQMSLPTELTLRTTPNGVRLFANPVKELDLLNDKLVVSEKNLSPDKANELLKPYANEAALRIKATVKISHATFWALALSGQNIIDYNLNFNTLNGVFYSQNDFAGMEVNAEIFIDKTTFQVFFDNGGISYCIERRPDPNNTEGFRFWSDRDFEIKNLEVFTMKNRWK